jgi:hypothetical protein
MRKRLNQLLVLLIILPLFMRLRCKGPHPVDYEYEFVEKVDLFPAQKTYHIGDTVWMQYVNPDRKFLDRQTNQRIQGDTLSVLFHVILNPLYNTVAGPAAGFCDFIIPAGGNAGSLLSQSGRDMVREFGCDPPNNYNFKIGIDFKEKGIFILELFGKSHIIRCNNRVNSFPESSMQFTFNLEDGNKDLFFSVPMDSRGGKSKSKALEKKIDERMSFVLKVE